MVKAQLTGNTVSITTDFVEAQSLYDKSQFGELTGKGSVKRIELALEEALYLIEHDKIDVYFLARPPFPLAQRIAEKYFVP